jgi:general secretion pathway protein E
MVGEIRDSETAEIAIQASLTGHLVFSTLHTNDAAGAITRLIDLGIEPFLVSSSLLCAMAQRLVRRLCPHCKKEYEISDAELVELGVDPRSYPVRKAYKPGVSECSACNGLRYQGRIGIHEMLVITDDIRPLILQRADSNALKAAAMRAYDFQTLRQDGLRKVLSGITSVEEVMLVTHEDT